MFLVLLSHLLLSWSFITNYTFKFWAITMANSPQLKHFINNNNSRPRVSNEETRGFFQSDISRFWYFLDDMSDCSGKNYKQKVQTSRFWSNENVTFDTFNAQIVICAQVFFALKVSLSNGRFQNAPLCQMHFWLESPLRVPFPSILE